MAKSKVSSKYNKPKMATIKPSKKIKKNTPKSQKEKKKLAGIAITPPSTLNQQQPSLNKEIKKNKPNNKRKREDLAVPITTPSALNQQQSHINKKIKANPPKSKKDRTGIPITPPSTSDQQRSRLRKKIRKDKRKSTKEKNDLALPNTPPSTVDQQRSKPQVPIASDIISIDSDDEDEDSNEEHSDKNRAYANLTNKDLETLKPKTWLNDAVIDASLQLLKEKYDQDDRVHISSSFFYTRLINAKTNKEGYYGTTKKWLNGVNLFNKKLWLVPVCHRSHWFLAAVTNPGKKHSTIFTLNSMRTNTMEVATNIRNFLLKKFRKEEEGQPKLRLPRIIHPSVPQQNNTNDCGLYLLRYAEAAMRHRRSITESVRKMTKHWEETPLPNRAQLKNELRKCMQMV